MAGNDHDVVIFPKGSDCTVEPAHLAVNEDDFITFFAIGTDITLFFPEPDIFNPRQVDPVRIKSGKNKKLKIKASAQRGVHSYGVHCEETSSFALGNSDPDIIIYG
ncbi:MAG TPA: hypothetical protein VGL91_05255 [Acidobacteriota bacterium]|jgi:hypothetical protein